MGSARFCKLCIHVLWEVGFGYRLPIYISFEERIEISVPLVIFCDKVLPVSSNHLLCTSVNFSFLICVQ